MVFFNKHGFKQIFPIEMDQSLTALKVRNSNVENLSKNWPSIFWYFWSWSCNGEWCWIHNYNTEKLFDIFESREMTCKQETSWNQPKIESEGKTKTRNWTKFLKTRKVHQKSNLKMLVSYLFCAPMLKCGRIVEQKWRMSLNYSARCCENRNFWKFMEKGQNLASTYIND